MWCLLQCNYSPEAWTHRFDDLQDAEVRGEVVCVPAHAPEHTAGEDGLRGGLIRTARPRHHRCVGGLTVETLCLLTAPHPHLGTELPRQTAISAQGRRHGLRDGRTGDLCVLQNTLQTHY